MVEYIHYEYEIVAIYNNEQVANVTFPEEYEGVVNVNHTFVRDDFRGRNIAGQLMMELVSNLEETNRKAILTCPYAVEWFLKNPQYSKFVKR